MHLENVKLQELFQWIDDGGIEMRIIENIIETFNPQAALRREVARQKCNYIRKITNSGYDEGGASHRKNSLKGWKARSESPQHDIDINLNTLRQRSRSLYMSAPLATSAIKSTRTNVVGAGLMLKPVIDFKYLGISSEEANGIKQQIIREWKIWAESKFCDNCRQNNFYELQQIAFLSWLLNGDALALIRYDKKVYPYQPYQLRLKLIESDKLCTPNSISEDYFGIDIQDKQSGNRIVNGVEIDKNGMVVAYHICNKYLSDYSNASREWTRVEAYGKNTGNQNIIHVFDAERCEQYRGVPFLAPVIESLKQLTRYQEAEIMAAVINGLFSVFIKTEDGGDNVDFDGIDEEENRNSDDDNEINLAPGVINYLKEGESIEIADAKRPNNNFDAFVSSMAKYVGAALEIPYEILMKSFTASYSASRGALLEAWKSYRMRRTWFANDFNKPIYEIWLCEAVSKGRVNCPGFFNDPIIRKAYSGSEWIGPSPGQLDPVKEAQAAEYRIKNGFSTRETEAAEINGSNFDNNAEQLQIENKKLNDAQVKEEQ